MCEEKSPSEEAPEVYDGPRVTPLQIAILSVLWDRGEATSAQVRSALEPAHALALTTVTTLLSRLERKGVLTHRRQGKRFVYTSTVSRDEVRRCEVNGLLNTLFLDDPELLVEYMIGQRLLERGDEA